jgi:hypothetical protein
VSGQVPAQLAFCMILKVLAEKFHGNRGFGIPRTILEEIIPKVLSPPRPRAPWRA